MLAISFLIVVLLVVVLSHCFTSWERDALRVMFRDAEDRGRRLFDLLRNAQAKRRRFQDETFKLRAKLKSEVESNFALCLELTKQENEHEVDIRDAHQRLRLMSIELAHTQNQLKLAEGRIKHVAGDRERLRLSLMSRSAPDAVPPESEITFRHGQVALKNTKKRKTAKGTKRKAKR